MKLAYKIIMTVCVIFIFVLSAEAAKVSVPGTSDPWLAGMPNGSHEGGDSAPGQSPVLLAGIPVVPGISYVFSASGLVGNGPPTAYPPDGDPVTIRTHSAGAVNGIADLATPNNSLVGIFLGSDRPNLSEPPAALDFSTSGSRNYLTLSPLLKQPFFIGDGLTDSEVEQSVTAPPGATRLFLGTMDNYQWSNNTGSFDVEVFSDTLPTELFLLPLGSDKLVAGTNQTIEWNSNDPNIYYVLIEYSANNGKTWNDIDIWENTGSYEWSPIPAVNSNHCFIRISDLFNPNNSDITDIAFTIFECLNKIAGDLNGDCYVDLRDFAVIADHWLNCGNPFDRSCQQNQLFRQ